MTKGNIEDKSYLKNKESINIKEFMILKSGEQDKLIEDTLNKVYEGKVEVNKKYLDKVLNVAFENKDNEVYLPHSLCVVKDGNKLIFSFKKKNMGLLFLFLLGFLFIAGFATFTGVQLLGKNQMNIDLNEDGVADLNIDLDDDGICDINCDIDGDRKPDRNIDYGGNRKAIFNVKRDDKTIFNKVNQLDENGKCYLNCDTNDDGWPDTNIDLDGDGKADLNIDVDGDGTPDLNIDTNKDGVADVNIDDDGDGICDRNCVSNIIDKNKGDLNLDLDGDGVCDVNCDTNGDGIPDEKIDYAGNKKPTFNVPDENGNLTNRTNQDKNGDGKCDLNCDIDGDGWPDINVDLDGDGKADLNIDVDGDGTPDLNIDTDGDGEADINIDEDGDGKCDKKCTYVVGDDNKGGQTTIGDNNINLEYTSLLVMFDEGNDVSLKDLYPDDQTDEGVNTKVPDITFTIENTTDRELKYNIDWINVENTFTSDNFWFKTVSNKGGFNTVSNNDGWLTAPKENGRMATEVVIAPKSKQEYKVSFTLHGTGEEQNYDQGKIFRGKVAIELIQ